MRTRTALVAIALLLAGLSGVARAPGAVTAAPGATVDTLLGAWNGQWVAPPGGGAAGSVELILGRAPGRAGVMGHFTFIVGGVSRTLRYEGHLDDGGLTFPLVGDGRIVLTPQTAARPDAASTLHGEWLDTRGALPGPEGMLRLNRVR